MNTKAVYILTVFLLTGANSFCQIVQPNQIDSSKIQNLAHANDIEIQGIIVDATQTKIGKDFYDLFYQQWNQIENLPNHSITINEKALPQLGSLISIHIEDQLIFQRVIQPRYDVIEQMVNYAVQYAYQYVKNYDEMQKQLQGEDLKGTGIY